MRVEAEGLNVGVKGEEQLQRERAADVRTGYQLGDDRGRSSSWLLDLMDAAMSDGKPRGAEYHAALTEYCPS